MSVLPMSEAQLQDGVVEVALLNGWLVFHDTDSRRNRAGFPDLVLVHTNHPAVVMEFKSAKGKLRPEQKVWLGIWSRWNPDVWVIRPDDYDWVIKFLSFRQLSTYEWDQRIAAHNAAMNP